MKNKYYYSDGVVLHYLDTNKKLHNDNGPSIELSNGDTFWYKDGKLHRGDGPAIEKNNGYTAYYINDMLHRVDGPAVTLASGDTSWYKDGKLHRDDGPAVEWVNGDKIWYKDGTKIKVNWPEIGQVMDEEKANAMTRKIKKEAEEILKLKKSKEDQQKRQNEILNNINKVTLPESYEKDAKLFRKSMEEYGKVIGRNCEKTRSTLESYGNVAKFHTQHLTKVIQFPRKRGTANLTLVYSAPTKKSFLSKILTMFDLTVKICKRLFTIKDEYLKEIRRN